MNINFFSWPILAGFYFSTELSHALISFIQISPKSNQIRFGPNFIFLYFFFHWMSRYYLAQCNNII